MVAFLLRRFAGFAVTLFAAAAVVFVVLEVLPGDPAAMVLGVSATPENLAVVRHDLGLDRPLAARFAGWIVGMLTGDFGASYTYRVPVARLVAERAVVTVPLAVMAIALAAAIGLPLGTVAAARAGRAVDLAATVFAQLGLAVPNFFFGILLVLLFSVGLGVMPSGGFPGWHAPLAALQALLLPAIALALPQAAIIARITRSAVLDVLSEEFVRTARMKGLSRAQTLRRHVLRNALIPILTILGLQFSFLVAGAIVIENVFSLPGLGRLMFQGIAQHDLVVVRSLVVIFAALVILVNFLVDLATGFIDPRIDLVGARN